jgi:hypothetical protein
VVYGQTPESKKSSSTALFDHVISALLSPNEIALHQIDNFNAKRCQVTLEIPLEMYDPIRLMYHIWA